MKYSVSLQLQIPHTHACELFLNQENWKKWQETLISYEYIAGVPGTPGAQTRMIHSFGKNQTEMIETIESNALPESMSCIYEAQNAWNRVVYRFKMVTPESTEWTIESEFKCKGVLKVVSIFFPQMFKKATLKDMRAFKEFVESTESVLK